MILAGWPIPEQPDCGVEDCGTRRCETCTERMTCTGPEPRACGVTCADCRCDCGPCAEAALDREDERRPARHAHHHPRPEGHTDEQPSRHLSRPHCERSIMNEQQSHYDAVDDYVAALGSRDPERIEAAGRSLNRAIQREAAAMAARVEARNGVKAPTWNDLQSASDPQDDADGVAARSVLGGDRCPKAWCIYPMPHIHTSSDASSEAPR